MAKKQKIAPNGCWKLSRDTWDTMPDLPFLMGVPIEPPFRLSFTLSDNKINRGRYLYSNPDKIFADVGDYIIHIGGYVTVVKQ